MMFTEDVQIDSEGSRSNSISQPAETKRKKLPRWLKITLIVLLVLTVALVLFIAGTVLFFIVIGRGILQGFESFIPELLGELFGGLIKEGVSQAAENAGENISEFIQNSIL